MSKLLNFIKEIRDIQSLLGINIENMNFVCPHLKYEFFLKNQKIIEYNTLGDKFYIIIEGNINIYEPIQDPLGFNGSWIGLYNN